MFSEHQGTLEVHDGGKFLFSKLRVGVIKTTFQKLVLRLSSGEMSTKA
jgi:hypothetical protein